MGDDSLQPKTQSQGNKPPPRPPCGTAVGLGPDDDDSDKRRRATITKPAEGEAKFSRRSNNRNSYAHVILKIEPNGRGNGSRVTSEASTSMIPTGYVRAVVNGVRGALAGGMVIGHPAVDGKPVVDVSVKVIGGSFHKTDSSDLAFKLAAIFAIRDAVGKANPIAIV